MQGKICKELQRRALGPGLEWERVIVSGCSRCRAFVQELGCPLVHDLPIISALAAYVPRRLLPAVAAARCVAYIEDDLRVQVHMNIAAPQVGARAVNRSGLTGRGVTLAIIDTGIYPHPDFTVPHSRIRAFVDILQKRQQPYDDNGHGTFCAGVAAGSGHMSDGKLAGIAPECELLIIKAMDKDGGGTASDVLAGMQWVIDNHRRYGVDVVSMSLGATTSSDMNDALTRGAERLWREGVVVVAAAGNNGPRPGSITSPGVAEKVITVGAANDGRQADRHADTIPNFSGRGPVGERVKPDIVAPGVAIHSVRADTDYISGPLKSGVEPYSVMTGTSVACPLVAGCCALLRQYDPRLTPCQIKDALMQTASELVGNPNAEGAGLVDIAAAVSHLRVSSKGA